MRPRKWAEIFLLAKGYHEHLIEDKNEVVCLALQVDSFVGLGWARRRGRQAASNRFKEFLY